LRELENILVLVQIKDKNWTKYNSNLRNLRSFSEPIDDADDGNANDNRSVTLYHGIPQKTGRVRIELNSDQREGSVATGPNAIRGRLRELENILVLVQINTKTGLNTILTCKIYVRFQNR
jgi:hypothetical protein